MKKLQVILSLCGIWTVANGLYLPKDDVGQKHDRLLRSWHNYKQKLQASKQLGYDKEFQQPIFDELEVLLMIPLITEQHRQGRLMDSEKELLSEIYGNLWTMIEEEARRELHRKINPLLKVLFDATRSLQTKGSPVFDSDIQHNTVQRIPKMPERKLHIRKTEDDHPSQKLLNMAAVLIRSMAASNTDETDSQSDRIRNSKFYRAVSPDPDILNYKTLTEQNFRSKRSQGSRLEDLPADRVDDLFRQLLHEKGIRFSNEENSEPDNDYYDIGDQQIDYVYDENYEYDGNSRSRSSFDSDYKNGSFQDLMLLAAKHRLREERDSKRSYY